MTKRNLSPAALAAKTIRAEIKRELGLTSRQVSVKADNYSMGSSINVEIRADVTATQLDAIKRIAKGQERVTRDEQGIMLLGGNRCVDIEISGDVIDGVEAILAADDDGSTRYYIDAAFDRMAKVTGLRVEFSHTHKVCECICERALARSVANEIGTVLTVSNESEWRAACGLDTADELIAACGS